VVVYKVRVNVDLILASPGAGYPNCPDAKRQLQSALWGMLTCQSRLLSPFWLSWHPANNCKACCSQWAQVIGKESDTGGASIALSVETSSKAVLREILPVF